MSLAMGACVVRSGVWKLPGILLTGLWVLCCPAEETPDLAAIESRVKAGFLYNFAKLTEWPTNSFAAADSPIVIGVLGNDPFGAILDDALRGKAIDGRKIR